MKPWDQVYKLPLHPDKYSNWVWDEKGHFVFQFETKSQYDRYLILKVLNNPTMIYPNFLGKVEHVKGYIQYIDTKQVLIKIRGWGQLTGIGGYNLAPDIASFVQDTFAEWIVYRLNNYVIHHIDNARDTSKLNS